MHTFFFSREDEKHYHFSFGNPKWQLLGPDRPFLFWLALVYPPLLRRRQWRLQFPRQVRFRIRPSATWPPFLGSWEPRFFSKRYSGWRGHRTLFLVGKMNLFKGFWSSSRLLSDSGNYEKTKCCFPNKTPKCRKLLRRWSQNLPL